MKKISLIAASLLFASTLAADSIDSAFKNGTVSGDVTLYGEKQNNSGFTKDAGFTMGSIGLGYETGDFNGFKASVGFRGNHDFSEVENGDYADGTEPDAILHTANISYANDYFGLTIGRQEIDLEWMGDFHEAAVLGITAIPNTTVVAGFSNRKGVADADAVLEKFDNINNDEGAFVLDAKYEGVEGLVVNPYYYNSENLASWYGLKVDYDTEIFGLTAHGAQSSEDTTSDDGEILHFDARTNLAGLDLNLGYITTDDKGAIGSMDAVGDNINPLEDGNQVYAADADTLYFGLGYEVKGVALSAIYGKSDYSTNEEKELNIGAEYAFTDSLSASALFVDVSAQDSNDDYNKFALTLAYSF